MKKYLLIILVLTASASLTGCDKLMEMYGIRKPAPEGTQNSEALALLQKVNNEDLAKFLLKPQRKPINIVRDPFKPLLEETAGGIDPLTGKKDKVSVDISLLGIVKLGDDYSVLLRSKTQKGVFKVGDTIETFTVKEISGDNVILNDGEKDIKLERGD